MSVPLWQSPPQASAEPLVPRSLVKRSPLLVSPLPPQIFLINLVRRPDRRRRMLASLRELEIAPRVVDAVDGR